MSALGIIIGLAGVAVLSSYLHVRHRQRVLDEQDQYDQREPAEWTGEPFLQ